MELRVGQPTDVDEIVVFDHGAVPGSPHLQFVHDQIAASACYVAVVDKKVVAYAVLNYNFYHNGWIEMLYVDPTFRRRGIGSSLIGHLVNECRTTKLFTSTNQSNLPMQQLLTMLGFSRSGFVENLDEGDPELVYFKQLHRPPGSHQEAQHFSTNEG